MCKKIKEIIKIKKIKIFKKIIENNFRGKFSLLI